MLFESFCYNKCHGPSDATLEAYNLALVMMMSRSSLTVESLTVTVYISFDLSEDS